MTNNHATLIGRVTEVHGNAITVALIDDEQGAPSIVTIRDEDVLIGQLGTYVAITQGQLTLLALITRMTEQERTASALPGTAGHEPIALPYAQRTLSVAPVGTINRDGEIERGISTYPTTGAEVHALGADDLARFFTRYKNKGYDVGELSSHPGMPVYLDPTPLFGRHTAILGQTGAGKSWTVATLVQRAVAIMPHAHIIILDLHGEYYWKHKDGTTASAFATESMRYIDARTLEIPYWLMTFTELCDLLIDRTEMSAHNQIAVFRDTLNNLRSEEGRQLGLARTTIDTPIFFDLSKVRQAIEAKNGLVPSESTGKPIRGALTGAFDNFLMRLDSRMNDVRYDFLLTPHTRTSSGTLAGLLRDFVGLGDPKRPITIIDLSHVPFDVRPTVTAQIGRLAFEFNYWNPQYREFPLLLICEEAHAYIPRTTESQFSGARRSMERIAKEGRKYGVGLVLVSQRPHELSETVLAQCGTFLCLRITNPEDQAYVRALVPEAERDLVDILAGLRRGEALALGEAVPLPTRFRFHLPTPAPNSDDIDFFKYWSSGPEDLDIDEIVNRWRRQER
jgi:DNA helicase HerA-like ATPase